MAYLTHSPRTVSEGALGGLVAGAVLAIAEVLLALLTGGSALTPFRMFASVAFGRVALGTMAPGLALLVGALVHFLLSAIFGGVYGRMNKPFEAETRGSWLRQSAIGLFFGLVLWFLNFQVTARILYPWFLAMPQVPQMLLHAFCFGLPLGLMLAAEEHRLFGVPHRVYQRSTRRPTR
jgi:NADH:ubiquinone oxidoreductase subunit 3 (subunit A)